MRRYRVLPDRGTLLVSTDLHGNGEDFRALREVFLSWAETDEAVHWVHLGDLVHAPDAQARRDEPELYDFPDESWTIVDGVSRLVRDWPEQFHLVLGNHDHGHVGGPRPAKFYPDEVGYLESTLNKPQLEQMKALFDGALLVVFAPCGVLLSHGSPDDSFTSPRLLDDISLDPMHNRAEQNAALRTILTSYGQRPTTTARLLRQLSSSLPFELWVVVHGHDRDSAGWFAEGLNQLCPVIFGAKKQDKRYLKLDLAHRYESVTDIRDGIEIKRLHAR